MRRRLLQLFNHSHVQAALVLTALLVVFLWTPLTQEGYLAPTDLLQSYIPFHTDPPIARSKNTIMSDPVLIMYPFFEWTRVQLQAGKLPLWNPYNAGGIPHLATFQAAVFSPFSLPYYVLDFRTALNFQRMHLLWFL